MQPVIKAHDVVQVLNKKTVLKGIDLEVPGGDALGIFGTRGTGKTTLLHLLAGIDHFHSGKVEILGMDIQKGNAYKKYLGLVTQERSLFQELKVAENLDFIATLRGGSRAGLGQLVESLELHPLLKEPVSTLEDGAYQRVALACALLGDPKILLADELIRDIDFYSQGLLLKTVRQFLKEGGTFVCGFSQMDYAGQLNRIAWLTDGQLTFYCPEEAVKEWQRQFQEINRQSGDPHD